ncbi:addiction module toxin RelE [Methylopila henanensis]|uniref:Addiction module toxin RelE n=1 Tax=Methylopila henanensis TaxID=873516 RepID=A0ABW4K9U8_9HYPH
MGPQFEVIQFCSEGYAIEFLLTRSFRREAADVFTAEERTGFMNYIAANPDAAPKIPGTSGIRKMRWKAKGFGKSGGARIIYYFRDLNMPLLLLAVYPKNHVVRLSAARMKEIGRKVDAIVRDYALANANTNRKSGRRA